MALTKRAWRSAFISIAIIISAAGLARATTVIMPTDTQLMIESRAIVRGKVNEISTALDDQHGLVYTYIKLKVTEVFKGDIRDRVIVIKEPGGSFGDRGSMIFGSPQFSAGEQVIVYLQTMDDGTLRVHDAFLGKYSIVKNASGDQMVVRGAPQGEVKILPQVSQGDATEQMELRAYLKMLRSGLSANMQKSVDFADQYYARTPMVSQPPEYQDKARSGGLQPEFHLLGPGRWTQPDRGQPVTYQINLTGAPSGFQADVDAAMAAWSTVAGCSLRVVDGGTTTSCPGTPGVAVADFSNCFNYFSSSAGSCQNILAEGGFQWDGNTSVVNGTTFHEISYGYIEFNPFASCYYGDSCSVKEVTTHEMGHSLGMGHSWDTNYPPPPTAAEQAATMYYIAHFDGRCASIRTDDINGITFIYPATSGSPGGPNYVGFVDGADCSTLRGWAADRNRLNTSINVQIYDGSTLISTVLANNSRPDVGAAIGDNGMHGFSIATPASLKNGISHTVHVKFETSATDLTNSPVSIACSSGAANYVGFVDQADCNTLRGWAADRNRLNVSINIEVYDGTTLIATVLANGSRPDVGAAIGDNGLHGFSLATPASLKNGTVHSVHVR